MEATSAKERMRGAGLATTLPRRTKEQSIVYSHANSLALHLSTRSPSTPPSTTLMPPMTANARPTVVSADHLLLCRRSRLWSV